MGSKFLTGGSSLSLLALQDGSFDANLLSITAQNLIPNYPAFSDNTKKIVSKKVDTGDCSFSVVSDLSNTGTGLSVYKNITPLGTGVLRTLSSGGGISLTYSGTDDEIIISSAGGSTVDALANVGTGAGVWKNTTGGTASLKSLIEGIGMTITSGTNDLTIATTALTNLQNTGTGITIASMGVANAANIKSLVAGNGIFITNGGTDITISTSDATLTSGTNILLASNISGSVVDFSSNATVLPTVIPSSWLIAGSTFEFVIDATVQSPTTTTSSIQLGTTSTSGSFVNTVNSAYTFNAGILYGVKCTIILQITALNLSTGLLNYRVSAVGIQSNITTSTYSDNNSLTLVSIATGLPWRMQATVATSSTVNWTRNIFYARRLC